MKHSAIPWILVALMGTYVYSLSHYAKNRPLPDPSYDFYDTTSVNIVIKGSEESHSITGQFNNILEGERQLTPARMIAPNTYKLVFKVNSPRPAMLYVDDEVIRIFLVPGDTSLDISMRYLPEKYLIDSLQFEGKTARICEYFQAKTVKFEHVHIRALRNTIATENLIHYGNKLDSLAARELGFLAEKEILFNLPDWFVNFERNEILYQKAYLKLSRIFNQPYPTAYLDEVKLSNEDAVFSYYYYLYLDAYFTHLSQQNTTELQDSDTRQKYLSLADTLLKEGPHDVFMTREIFSYLASQPDLAEKLFEIYEDNFFSKKYVRFLDTQINQRKKTIKSEAVLLNSDD